MQDEDTVKKPFRTKRPLTLVGSVRMPEATIKLLREAALVEGISQSELLRRATVIEALKILRRRSTQPPAQATG
jgi:hypothetical protein